MAGHPASLSFAGPSLECNFKVTGPLRNASRFPRQLMGQGPWEQIFHGEFDGNRAKRVLVKIIGE